MRLAFENADRIMKKDTHFGGKKENNLMLIKGESNEELRRKPFQFLL